MITIAFRQRFFVDQRRQDFLELLDVFASVRLGKRAQRDRVGDTHIKRTVRSPSTQEDVPAPLIGSWTRDDRSKAAYPSAASSGLSSSVRLTSMFGHSSEIKPGSDAVGATDQVERLGEDVSFFQDEVQGQGRFAYSDHYSPPNGSEGDSSLYIVNVR